MQFTVSGETQEAIGASQKASDYRAALDDFTAAAGLPVHMRAYDGAVRYCDKCKVVKPDRSHHCSICGQCVLKFDHHCPYTPSTTLPSDALSDLA